MLLLSCKFYFELLFEYLLTTTLELELNLVCWSTGFADYYDDDLKFPELVNDDESEPPSTAEFLPLWSDVENLSDLSVLLRAAAEEGIPSIF